LGYVVALVGLGVIAINIAGIARGSGLYRLDKPFGEDERGLGRTRPIRRYSELLRDAGESNDAYARRLVVALNGHLIHSMGSRLPRVSIFQNWILWLLGFLWPSRFRHLEFRTARHAVRRGFGLCSQAALALADLLSRAHIPVAIAELEGHVVVTAETAPGRSIVLDPDYGATIPMTPDQVRADPATAVAEAYGGRYGPSVIERLSAAYAERARLRPFGGPRDRLRAALEEALFALKWLIPLCLVALGSRRWLAAG
jgi:hypothetical protein